MPCISRTSVLLYWRQDIGCLWLISFPVVLQPPRALFRCCLSASIVCCCCLFFFSHRPLKLEQCLHTGTCDNPANNGFTSLVRSCTASICLLNRPFPSFSSVSYSSSTPFPVEKAVMLPEAVRLPQCGFFTGKCVLPVILWRTQGLLEGIGGPHWCSGEGHQNMLCRNCVVQCFGREISGLD